MKQPIFVLLTGGLLIAGSNTAFAQKGHGMGAGVSGGGPHVRAVSTPPAARDNDGAGARKSVNRANGKAHTMTGKAPFDVSQQIAANPNLANVLQPLLPSGENIATASAGFKNMGQFVAALHVANNLGIPFDQLKADITGPNAESLGKAIQALKPNMSSSDIKTAIHTARDETDANFDTAHINAELAKDPAVAAKIQALLPTGVTAQSAAVGFENVRQLLAAEHLAQDLNIPFAKIQALMTGSDSESLAKALLSLDPTMTSAAVKTAVKTANQQAVADLKAAGEFAPGEDLAEGK